ncbi:FKBP-type peptidyl-prolyl cis-trans isomerase [Lutibacter sp.]|uniref:FKBP-type peptidyl-prolyl cis-trans isomerase n=1 Tax=Lutibacter sp. TaxID=1925666 RepID=UPI002736D201|nr:FKBP-type peptidyl-prolyl cis-trans isomerase [Lutibacter sp.]MDP3311802.1 FKBP-type peptidyl-prolyl cis-trans isomerase [Lutibacter sp.]
MKISKFLAVALVASMFVACNNQKATKESLKTEVDSVSYTLGLDMGYKLKQNFPEINRELYLQGVLSGVDSVNILIEQKDIETVLGTFFQKKREETMKKEQEEQMKSVEKEFGDVKKAGEKFMEENKKAPGVKVTASGLQYVVIKEGKGEKPIEGSNVKVHYHGTLTDGVTVFDSSVDRKEPAQFNINQVIPGWTEGLQLMTVGSKYKFIVPQELGYGAFPRPDGAIKPFMPLIFEVELLEIIK